MADRNLRTFLRAGNVPEDKIARFLAAVEKFAGFLARTGRQKPHELLTSDDVEAFAALLIEEGANDHESFYALISYGRFLKNNALVAAALELIDGAEVMANLHRKLGEESGPELRDEVFRGVALPPLGTPPRCKPALMSTVMARMERLVDAEASRRIFAGGLRDLDRAWYRQNREKFLACGGLDEFLALKGRDFLAELQRLKNAGELLFTLEVTDEVIEYVRQNPLIREGVREGGVLYEVKIPYMPRQYLAERDGDRRRYYYCHCPWVRESLRHGRSGIPASFCRCSAAFMRNYWEAVLDQPLEAEMVETVLKGDLWCKVAIRLPEGFA